MLNHVINVNNVNNFYVIYIDGILNYICNKNELLETLEKVEKNLSNP